MCDIETRVEMAKKSLSKIENIEVKAFDNLLVEFCQEHNIKTIIRGLRAVSDFEYELQMGYTNASLDKNIDTIYLMPNLEYAL